MEDREKQMKESDKIVNSMKRRLSVLLLVLIAAGFVAIMIGIIVAVFHP